MHRDLNWREQIKGPNPERKKKRRKRTKRRRGNRRQHVYTYYKQNQTQCDMDIIDARKTEIVKENKETGEQ
jgi:hypothetical protein